MHSVSLKCCHPPPKTTFTSSKLPSHLDSVLKLLSGFFCLFTSSQQYPSIYHLPSEWLPPLFFCFNYWGIVDLQCCASVRCTAKWITYICIYIYIYTHTYIYPFFFRFFSHSAHHRVTSSPCNTVKSLLVIYFIHSTVYTSIPILKFIPPPFSPW